MWNRVIAVYQRVPRLDEDDKLTPGWTAPEIRQAGNTLGFVQILDDVLPTLSDALPWTTLKVALGLLYIAKDGVAHPLDQEAFSRSDSEHNCLPPSGWLVLVALCIARYTEPEWCQCLRCPGSGCTKANKQVHVADRSEGISRCAQGGLTNERDFPVPWLRRKPRSATGAMMELAHHINTTQGEVHEPYHRRP